MKALLVVASFALAATAVAARVDLRAAAFAYLAAFACGLGVALGALFLLAITHVAHARWFVALRRVAEALAATLPLFAVAFVPVVLVAPVLYPWAGDLAQLGDEARRVIASRGAWHALPFFAARAAFYFATWIAIATLLRRASLAGDVRRQRVVSAVALPVLALTATFAAFDWLMSVDATWASDMYGVAFFAGSFASAAGAVAVGAFAARRAGALPAGVSAAHAHALGRVLLLAVAFWAYIAFCPLLLVWIANLPREVGYYAARARGPAGVLSIALALGHFVVPFFVLLSRPLKRRFGFVAFAGAWLVAAHALDVWWLVLPARGRGAAPSLLDLAPMVFVLAAGAAAAVRAFAAVAPVPSADPDLAPSLRYESP